MKIVSYTDVHLSQYSSIVRGRGENFSTRLENCIKSINWAEEYATTENADAVVIGGDFFDKPTLNAEELSALLEIKWTNVPHYILIGNHEMSSQDLRYSSAHILKHIPNAVLITESSWISAGDTRIVFLPYILESNRKDFKYYIDNAVPLTNTPYAHTIVYSHNDISGIRYGQIMSKIGFNIKEISDNCDLYINGHLHNQTKVSAKILNLGNLTGQNFGEDALSHSHCLSVVDTEKLTIDLVNNPYALNFYKIDSLVDLTRYYNDNVFDSSRSVITIKVRDGEYDEAKEICDKCALEYKIVVSYDKPAIEETKPVLQTIDHISQLKTYCVEHLGNTEELHEELNLL